MSTFPEPKSDSEAKKLIVTLMLKVPIEIELDISQNQLTECSQLSSQEINCIIDNFEEIPVTDQLSKSDSIGDVLISSSKGDTNNKISNRIKDIENVRQLAQRVACIARRSRSASIMGKTLRAQAKDCCAFLRQEKGDGWRFYLLEGPKLKQIVAKTIANHQFVCSWCKYWLLPLQYLLRKYVLKVIYQLNLFLVE